VFALLRRRSESVSARSTAREPGQRDSTVPASSAITGGYHDLEQLPAASLRPARSRELRRAGPACLSAGSGAFASSRRFRLFRGLVGDRLALRC
jgi:hypothetical protein